MPCGREGQLFGKGSVQFFMFLTYIHDALNSRSNSVDCGQKDNPMFHVCQLEGNGQRGLIQEMEILEGLGCIDHFAQGCRMEGCHVIS